MSHHLHFTCGHVIDTDYPIDNRRPADQLDVTYGHACPKCLCESKAKYLFVVDGGATNNQHADKRRAYFTVALFGDDKEYEFTLGGVRGFHYEEEVPAHTGNTNQVAELWAWIEVMGYIEAWRKTKPGVDVEVVGDSKYVLDWISGANFRVDKAKNAEIIKTMLGFYNKAGKPSAKRVSEEVVKMIIGH